MRMIELDKSQIALNTIESVSLEAGALEPNNKKKIIGTIQNIIKTVSNRNNKLLKIKCHKSVSDCRIFLNNM